MRVGVESGDGEDEDGRDEDGEDNDDDDDTDDDDDDKENKDESVDPACSAVASARLAGDDGDIPRHNLKTMKRTNSAGFL